MPKLTFFPLGNADCCLMDLAGGEKLLFDYAAMRNPDDKDDLRIDLPGELRKDLKAAKRNHFDVVAISHLDNDHVCKFGEFFYLEHDKKYQDDKRVKITTLWVPASVIVEAGCEDDAKIVQAEARHRLKAGKGIRVFSRPDKLKAWLEKQGLTMASRQALITDAGQLIPEFTKNAQGVEFFVHSPFASRTADGTLLDRNDDALAMQATFSVNGVETKLLLMADLTHEVLTTMVDVTRYHKNDARLQWDIFKLPHHCSYLSLGPEKGKDKTKPVPNVKWLFDQGQKGGTIVSTSKPISSNDDDDQPPHRQAANFYKELVASDKLDGEFLVTMEHPKRSDPKPIVIKIDGRKATHEKPFSGGIAAIVTRDAPRAG